MSKNKKKGGFMSGLSGFGKAALDKANSAMKDVKNFVTNPKHNFSEGNILGLISCTSDKCLMIAQGGFLMCGSHQKQYMTDRFCQFEVMAGGSLHPHSIKLRCVANQFYLGLFNGVISGSGCGGPECDFLVHTVNDEHGTPTWVCLESAISPGYHLGMLPTGQLTAPSLTTIDCTASHFTVKCIDRREYTPQSSHCSQPPPTACDSHVTMSCDALEPPGIHCSLSPSHTVHSSVHGHTSVAMSCPNPAIGNPYPPPGVCHPPPCSAPPTHALHSNMYAGSQSFSMTVGDIAMTQDSCGHASVSCSAPVPVVHANTFIGGPCPPPVASYPPPCSAPPSACNPYPPPTGCYPPPY